MDLVSPLRFHAICNVLVARRMALHYGRLPNAYSSASFAPSPDSETVTAGCPRLQERLGPTRETLRDHERRPRAYVGFFSALLDLRQGGPPVLYFAAGPVG